MPIEFKDSIDVDGNIKASQAFIDSNDSAGTIGQILTSTGSVSQWSDVVPGASTLVEIACKNTSGGTITVGTPVYQTGTVGATATIEVAPANALMSAGNYPAIGLLKTTLGNNDIGFVVITGALTNIITSPIDGAVPTTGDTVYLKSGGGLTLTKPTGEGNAIQNMGLVGKVSTGTAGYITVSSIMRANDVPNLPEGRIWVGDDNTLVSNTVFVDEPNLRLGIGTTSPTRALHVKGSGSSSAEFQIQGDTTSLYLGSGFGIGYTDAVDLRFLTNNTEKMRITSGGNVGIGTTTPTEALHVKGSGSSSAEFQMQGDTTSLYLGSGFGIGYTDAVDLRFLTNNTEKMRITSGGNVGIGTTSPTRALDVVGKIALNDGGNSVFVGESAGANDDGSNNENTSVGFRSLRENTTGAYNTAIGAYSLFETTTGFGNTSVGRISLENNTSGNFNNGQGYQSLLFNTTGSYNIANGYQSGSLILDGTTANTITNKSVYIGSNTKALANNQTNQIVIGYDATGIGSNSVVLGNDSIDVTSLKGNVGIGNTAPTEKLDVSGNIKAEGSVQVGNNNNTATASNVGAMRYRTDGSASYSDMAMETTAGVYAWVNIVTNTF